MYTWPLHTRIAELSEKYNLAVIMPSGENSYYLDRDDFFASYGKFIGEELVNKTRTLFPLSDKREDTFIGGFSMGGYGSLYNGLNNPDTFSKIITFAPSLELFFKPDASYDDPFPKNKGYIEAHYGPMEKAYNTNKDIPWLIDEMKKNNVNFPEIFMRTGEDDPIRKTHAMLEEKYKEAGINYTAKIVPGAHEWDFINRNFEDAISWLCK